MDMNATFDQVARSVKTRLTGLLATRGYLLFRTDPAGEEVRPLATYAPWRDDAAFRAVYEKVRGHSLVDVYRLWELWTLTAQAAKAGGAIVEVGVWRGGSTAVIASQAARLGLAGPFYACDTFAGVVGTSAADPYYAGGEHDDTSRERVESFLRDTMGLTNVTLLTGMFPQESASQVADGPVCLCHVDVDAYESARAVTEWVWPRLAVGGIVVYDDYGFASTPGVTRYVDELRGAADRVYLHNLNGHAVLVKVR